MFTQVEEELFGSLAGRPSRLLAWFAIVFGLAAAWMCTRDAMQAVFEEAQARAQMEGRETT